MILNPAVLLLNYFKYHLLAEIYFNMLAVLTFSTISLLAGHETNMHLYLFLVIIVAFFIYPANRKHFMYSIVLIALGSFIGLELWFLNHDSILNLSPEFIKTITFTANIGLIIYILAFSFYTYTIYMRAENNLEKERKKSESLLHNILPVKIADRLKTNPDAIADKFENTSILFADLVGFTLLSEQTPPERVVQILNDVFSRFDNLADRYNLEKIKTIGDAYMVVAGLPSPRDDHAEAIAEFALDMWEILKDYKVDGKSLKLRVGINSGPAVAGVIGKKKLYMIYGVIALILQRAWNRMEFQEKFRSPRLHMNYSRISMIL